MRPYHYILILTGIMTGSVAVAFDTGMYVSAVWSAYIVGGLSVVFVWSYILDQQETPKFEGRA